MRDSAAYSARRPRGTDSGAHWISYSDMMASILMVFVLAIVYSVYQYNTILKQKTEELNLRQAQLILAQTELDEQKSANEAFRIRLQSQQELIIIQQNELEAAQSDLQEKQGELEKALIILTAQQKELADREADVLSLQALLNEQEEKIETLVGIRPRIISDLTAALSANHIPATIDPNTGDIKLESYVFFDTNRSEIKQSGLDTLNRFLPVYLSVLMQEEYREYVAEIIIEGHTDSSGTYLDNLRLSQNRALAVAEYCFRMPGLTDGMRAKLEEILTATGRSESDLVYNEDGTEDQVSSRRVEFKFRLKDTQMLEQMNRILKQASGGTDQPAGNPVTVTGPGTGTAPGQTAEPLPASTPAPTAAPAVPGGLRFGT